MASSADEPENALPPPGNRSGAGAQSVLPYLTKTLQARPAAPSGAEHREREQQGTGEQQRTFPAS